jgi:hypothetical protein
MFFALFLIDGALACDHPTTRAELSGALGSAEASFKTMDLPAFQSGFGAATSALGCLGETVQPLDAARYHRAAGLAAFFGRDVPGAQKAFAAARALDPAFAWDGNAAPAGGPVQIAYSTLSVENPQRKALDVPTTVTLQVDGAAATTRPVAWPSIVQILAPSGAVLSTNWLRAEDAVPLPAALPMASGAGSESAADGTGSSSTTSTQAVSRKSSLKVPLLVTAGVAAAGAAALYGGALATKSEFEASTDYHEMESLVGTNNALFWGSVGAGGLAVASGVSAFVVGSVGASF